MNAPDLREVRTVTQGDHNRRISAALYAYCVNHNDGFTGALIYLRNELDELERERDMQIHEPDDRYLDDPRRGQAKSINAHRRNPL